MLSDTRRTLQKWLSLLIAGLNGIYFTLNLIFSYNAELAIIEFTVVAFGIYTFYACLKRRDQSWHCYALMAILTTNILVTVYSKELYAGSIFWGLTLPLWSYILFGLRKGFLFTALIALPSVYILFNKVDFDMAYPYRIILNFTLAYCTVWAVCHLYEYQRIKADLTLKKIALLDSLTGIQNRHALKNYFASINDKNNSIHMLIIDIDHFKNINDEFGHEAGDKVLVEVAQLLKQHTQSEDAYRIGGEEFVVILKNAIETKIHDYAESIRKAMEEHVFRCNEITIELTVSIGIAKLLSGQDFNACLRIADKHLYQAKDEGRNLVRG